MLAHWRRRSKESRSWIVAHDPSRAEPSPKVWWPRPPPPLWSARRAPARARAQEATTVTFWQFSTNDFEIQAYNDAIAAFSEQNPDVTVNMEIVPWAEQQQKLVTGLDDRQPARRLHARQQRRRAVPGPRRPGAADRLLRGVVRRDRTRHHRGHLAGRRALLQARRRLVGLAGGRGDAQPLLPQGSLRRGRHRRPRRRPGTRRGRWPRR